MPKTKPVDFQSIFEAVPGLYLILAPDLTILAASNAYLAATLTERAAILGKGLFEVFPDNPDDPTATGVSNLRLSLERVIARLKPDSMAVQKYDIRKADGSFEERFWSPVNTPVLDKSGRLFYIVHRVEDVTEFMRLKQKDVKQGQLNAELVSRTAQMESEIYERAQQLQKANERLRELDRLKTQFFSNVSHELRTPLTLILGPVAKLLMLLEKRMPNEFAEMLKHDLMVIERNAHTLLRHVNDLLDVSKLESGRVAVNYIDFDLSQLLRQVISNFESLAEEKSTALAIVAPESLPIQADANKVQRVILNLLSNAFKFTPSGRGIRCSAKIDGDYAVLVVEDGGPGVPAHLRQAVFERFYQVEESSTRRFGGTGLGLAIAQDFVALHQGSIALTESELGGARFEVKLPLLAPAGATVRAQSPVGLAAIDPGPGPRNIVPLGPTDNAPEDAPHILIVEDNAEMSQYLQDVLCADYHVTLAGNGREGLEKAHRLKPDLIITDLMMPEMNGEQLLGAVVRDPEIQGIPVIVLTARTEDELRVRLLRSGACDFLMKPFMPEELRVRVSHHTTVKQTRDYLTRELKVLMQSQPAAKESQDSVGSMNLLSLVQELSQHTAKSRTV